MTLLEFLQSKNIKIPKDCPVDLEDLFRYIEDVTSTNDAVNCLYDLDADGAIHEAIDSAVDIYTADLWKWAANNYEYIDMAIDEGFCTLDNGIVSCLQAGQYYQINEEVWTIINDITNKLDDLLE